MKIWEYVYSPKYKQPDEIFKDYRESINQFREKMHHSDSGTAKNLPHIQTF